MKDKRLTHLLMPKAFRVWCRPNVLPGDFHVTIYPSKVNCANCLTSYRISLANNHKEFLVKHTFNRPPCK